MKFKVLDPAQETITLPVLTPSGQVTEYQIESPSWEVGVAVNQFMEVGLRAKAFAEAVAEVGFENVPAEKHLTAEEKAIAREWDNEQAGRQVLGDTFDAMVADGLPLAVIQRAIYTAVTWVLSTPEDAARVWDEGANPKDTRRKPLDRQPKTSSKAKGGSRKRT